MLFFDVLPLAQQQQAAAAAQRRQRRQAAAASSSSGSSSSSSSSGSSSRQARRRRSKTKASRARHASAHVSSRVTYAPNVFRMPDSLHKTVDCHASPLFVVHHFARQSHWKPGRYGTVRHDVTVMPVARCIALVPCVYLSANAIRFLLRHAMSCLCFSTSSL